MVKKAVITNLKTGQRIESLSLGFPNDQFQTLEDFTNYQSSIGAYGKPERWLRQHEIEASGEDLLSALESRVVPADAQPVDGDPENPVLETQFRFAAEFTVEYVDITEEVETTKGIAKNEARIAFGVKLFAELAYRNKRRLLAGLTTVGEIFAAEEKLAKIQRLMGNSSTEKALQEMMVLDIPELPQSEKDYFMLKIQSYLEAEQ